MVSRRPYLLRALYEWMTDTGQTPYLLVDASRPDVIVPRQYVQDGRIVLDISPLATQQLSIGNQNVEFEARFGGIAFHVVVPVGAVMAIYARESGEGMLFGADDAAVMRGLAAPVKPAATSGVEPPEPPTRPRGKPDLKVIK
ncbi:MAG TPA: ClpXP protease specificity-enhancing factor [Gammaproteobacteria bacterium]|nr:ClpXP protease specificity-enhancing factor [Gammaproteobacteria bacterium]